MNHLSDQQLRFSIKSLVGTEREILHKILLHLREIDRRKLFSEDGFPSLRSYAMTELKYSEDQADRRIAAMRLLRDMPEVETKIIDGSLTLSSLAQAQWHFKKNDLTELEKTEVLKRLENASKKETRAILKNEDMVRYSFGADEATELMVERLKGLHPHLSFDQLMKKVCEMALDRTDPFKKIERAQSRTLKKQNSQLSKTGAAEEPKRNETAACLIKSVPPSTRAGRVERSRYIPAETKRNVWLESQGKCQNCSSTFALEYDHVVPFAKGGSSDKDNLRLLCKSCNQRLAIEQYSLKKITSYF